MSDDTRFRWVHCRCHPEPPWARIDTEQMRITFSCSVCKEHVATFDLDGESYGKGGDDE